MGRLRFKNLASKTLLATLNRREVFDDLRTGTSIQTILQKPLETTYCGVGNFLLQMVLVYELSIRLPGVHQTNGAIPPFVNPALEMSRRWVASVKCYPVPGDTTQVRFECLVQERQIEGLVRFAKALEWPYLDKVRTYLKDVYARVARGERMMVHLWD